MTNCSYLISFRTSSLAFLQLISCLESAICNIPMWSGNSLSELFMYHLQLKCSFSIFILIVKVCLGTLWWMFLKPFYWISGPKLFFSDNSKIIFFLHLYSWNFTVKISNHCIICYVETWRNKYENPNISF